MMWMESLMIFFKTLIPIVIIAFTLKDLFSTLAEIVEDIEFKRKWVNIPWKILLYILSCSKCSSFWMSMILSGGNLLISSLVSISIVLLEKWVSPFLNETKLD